MATTTAITQDRETVSGLCWRVLGTAAGGVFEQVLALNSCLADLGTVLPAGITVTLLTISPNQPATIEVVQLWT